MPPSSKKPLLSARAREDFALLLIGKMLYGMIIMQNGRGGISMKYSVKKIIRHTVESGQVFL